jgi:hypothetical protein
VKFGFVFDFLRERQLRSRKQTHRNLGLSNSGETPSDGPVKLGRYQLVANLSGREATRCKL